jgi:Mg-chelatase subunit ChlD
VSPEVGELDELAIDEGMSEDPDDLLALLADLTGATDVKLRELARRMAGRLFLDIARRGAARSRGVGRMRDLPYRPDGGDLDLDASLDAIVAAGRGAVDPERLRIRGWVRPDTAWCLLVDRSGSMGGRPLATAAVAAATVAWRSPADYSVLAFGKDVVVVKPQDAVKPADRVVSDLLALRGFGTTDLAGALHVAATQLARSRAARKIAIVLSDCRATVEGDPTAAAARLDELVILAPQADSDEAAAFASRVGARLALVAGPASVGDALTAAITG